MLQYREVHQLVTRNGFRISVKYNLFYMVVLFVFLLVRALIEISNLAFDGSLLP